MRRIILGAALNILTGVAPNLTAHASSEDLTDLIQNAECRDGYETQTNKLKQLLRFDGASLRE
ncbi:hypothetical protein F1643_21000 [Azospirillum sp. INR13]|uniref:hypothetical protein n=1 Tax=Azospirillum sp. INR13 TaxID=2596919 RepID=UPI0018926641|nr:hypothetical protein [Azospirillum sp. INR13]MBF5096478.1 hypothetical protein [Azospirillum sp. INR13]